MIRLRPLRFLPAGRESRSLVPWVIAVMMFLCGLGLIVGVSLNGVLRDWSGRLQRSLTVQVVVADAEEQTRQAAAAEAMLSGVAGIASVRRLDDSDVAQLLEPWLGRGNVVEDLPIPAILEVELQPGRQINVPALRAALTRAAPDAHLDDHGQWLAQLLTFSRLIQTLAWIVVALLVATTATIVIFGARAGLASHAKTVEIMHLMGAEDRVIAGEFQYRFLLHGLKGGVAGTLLCLAALFALNATVAELGKGLLPQLAAGPAMVVLLAALPLAAGLLTMLTARMTVLSALKKMV